MYARPPRQQTQPPAARKAGVRLRRLAGVLAAVTCGLLVWGRSAGCGAGDKHPAPDPVPGQDSALQGRAPIRRPEGS